MELSGLNKHRLYDRTHRYGHHLFGNACKRLYDCNSADDRVHRPDDEDVSRPVRKSISPRDNEDDRPQDDARMMFQHPDGDNNNNHLYLHVEANILLDSKSNHERHVAVVVVVVVVFDLFVALLLPIVVVLLVDSECVPEQALYAGVGQVDRNDLRDCVRRDDHVGHADPDAYHVACADQNEVHARVNHDGHLCHE